MKITEMLPLNMYTINLREIFLPHDLCIGDYFQSAKRPTTLNMVPHRLMNGSEHYWIKQVCRIRFSVHELTSSVL